MKNEYNIIDDAFQKRLQGAELPFEDAAWEKMAQKLDASNRRRFVGFISNSGMLLAGIIILVFGFSIFLFFRNTISSLADKNHKAENQVEANRQKSSSEIVPPINEMPFVEDSADHSVKNNKPVFIKRNQRSSSTLVTKSISEIQANSEGSIVETNFTERPNRIEFIGFSFNKTRIQFPELIDLTNQIENENLRQKGAPFILGLHYQNLLSFSDFKAAGYQNMNGIDLEILSRNLFSSKGMQIRYGANLGFALASSSRKYELLNLAAAPVANNIFTVNITSLHFNAISRLEFGSSRLKPYMDVFAGMRTFKTSYSSNNGSNSIQNATNQFSLLSNPEPVKSYSFQYGVSAGGYYRINARVAIDSRISFTNGTPISNIPNADALINSWSNNVSAKSLVTPPVKPQLIGVNFGFFYFL